MSNPSNKTIKSLTNEEVVELIKRFDGVKSTLVRFLIEEYKAKDREIEETFGIRRQHVNSIRNSYTKTNKNLNKFASIFEQARNS